MSTEETATPASVVLPPTTSGDVQRIESNNNVIIAAMAVAAMVPSIAESSKKVDIEALNALNNKARQIQVENESVQNPVDQEPVVSPTPIPTEIIVPTELAPVPSADTRQVIFYKVYEAQVGDSQISGDIARDIQGNIDMAVSHNVPFEALQWQILNVEGNNEVYQVPIVTLSRDFDGHSKGSIVIPLVIENADKTVSESVVFFDSPGEGYIPGILPLEFKTSDGQPTQYGTPVFNVQTSEGNLVPSVLFEFTYDPNTYKFTPVSVPIYEAVVNRPSGVNVRDLDNTGNVSEVVPSGERVFVIGEGPDIKNFASYQVITRSGHRGAIVRDGLNVEERKLPAPIFNVENATPPESMMHPEISRDRIFSYSVTSPDGTKITIDVRGNRDELKKAGVPEAAITDADIAAMQDIASLILKDMGGDKIIPVLATDYPVFHSSNRPGENGLHMGQKMEDINLGLPVTLNVTTDINKASNMVPILYDQNGLAVAYGIESRSDDGRLVMDLLFVPTSGWDGTWGNALLEPLLQIAHYEDYKLNGQGYEYMNQDLAESMRTGVQGLALLPNKSQILQVFNNSIGTRH